MASHPTAIAPAGPPGGPRRRRPTRWVVLLTALAALATACVGDAAPADGPALARADLSVRDLADRFGVFARATPEGMQIWAEDGRGEVRIDSSCATAGLTGAEVGTLFFPVSTVDPQLCSAEGSTRLDQPFGITRGGQGLTLTVGPDQLVFSRPFDLPLPPAFTAGSFRVTGASSPGFRPGRPIEIQLGDDRLWGRSGCLAFEVPVQRTGSFLVTGDVRYSRPTCTGDEEIVALLADRSLAALDSAHGPVLVAGWFQGLSLQPTGTGLNRPGGLELTLHRDPAPVTGQFHATSYTVNGQTRATPAAFPFRLTLDDDGATWQPDCNRTTAGGWWTAGRFVRTGGGTTTAACDDGAAQAAELALDDGFAIEGDREHPILVSGPVRAPLEPGPAGAGAPIPAGHWVVSSLTTSAGGFGPATHGLGGPGGSDGGAGAGPTLDAGADGAAVLHTGCRDVALRLAVTPRAVAELPPSRCGPADPGAALDVWLASVVADRFDVAVFDSTLTLTGPYRGVELRQA